MPTIKPRATVLMIKSDSILMIHCFRDGNEYYVLPGGGVEAGETPELATLRELKEETSILGKIEQRVADFTDKEGRNHQIFLCTRIAGEPKLSDDSPEKMKQTKTNTYEPKWVEIDSLPSLVIWPEGTKDFLVKQFNL